MYSKKLTLVLAAIGIFLSGFFPLVVEAKNTNATWDQEHFWFRDDDGSESGASGYSTGDLAVDAVIGASETFAVGQAFRLRMTLLKDNNGDLNLTTTPKLQFKAAGTTGDCTVDTWTDVPPEPSCSTTAFCQATSGNFTDDIATTRQTDILHTHVGGDMIETEGSPDSATFGTSNKTDHAEWEWMLDSDNAAASTIYTFRLIKSGGTPYATYTTCPTLETDAAAATTLTQNNFLIYVDNDALDPTDIWGNPDIGGGSENSTLNALPYSNDPIDVYDEVRLRMNITVTGATLAASSEGFILQYAEASSCTVATSWTEMAAAGAGSVWEFADSTVTDNTALGSDPPGAGEVNLTESDVAGRYNKSDPTTTNPFEVLATPPEDLEWDWHIEYVGNAEAHTYCFRMIKDDSSDLDGYNSDSYPRVDTRPTTADFMRHGNFFTTGIERGFFWTD